jgi:hypothetical protein
VSPNAPDRRAGGIPATKRALAIAAVEGGRKCVSWPFEAWATSDGRGMSSSAGFETR